MKQIFLFLSILMATLNSICQESPDILYRFDVLGEDPIYMMEDCSYGEGGTNSHIYTLAGGQYEGEILGVYVAVEDSTRPVPGTLGSISQNGNGDWVITCAVSQNTCFHVNTLVKVIEEDKINLGIINSNIYSPYNVIVSDNLNYAITGSNEVSAYFSGENVFEHELSPSELSELEGREGIQVLGYVYGIISGMSQFGNTYVVNCITGPGWCIRFAKPDISVVGDLLE